MERTESKKFIEIQIRFAERLAALSKSGLDEVLEQQTVFRQILGMPYGDAIREQPLWQEFVGGLQQQVDKVEWAYNFHLNHLPQPRKSDSVRFGCFYYDDHFRPTIRLHFGNPTNGSVLNKELMETRQSELRSLFRYIRQHHPEAERVQGSSWLYNIEAYRRLFPPKYVETAKPVGYAAGFFSLWGQFLRGDRSIRSKLATHFLGCLAEQNTVDGCMGCFPYQVLRPECAIELFYRFYVSSQ